MDQIKAIIQASVSCEQRITYKCFLAPLKGSGMDEYNNYIWKNGDFRDTHYFHSNSSIEFINDTPHGCACGNYDSL